MNRILMATVLMALSPASHATWYECDFYYGGTGLGSHWSLGVEADSKADAPALAKKEMAKFGHTGWKSVTCSAAYGQSKPDEKYRRPYRK
jgi:hypothetical protein